MDPQQFGRDLATVLNNIKTDGRKMPEIDDQAAYKVKGKIKSLNDKLQNTDGYSKKAKELIKDLNLFNDTFSLSDVIKELNNHFNGNSDNKALLRPKPRLLNRIKTQYNTNIPNHLNIKANTIAQNKDLAEDETEFLQALAEHYTDADELQYKDTHPNQYLLIKHAGLVKNLKDNHKDINAETDLSNSGPDDLIPNEDPKTEDGLNTIKKNMTEHINRLQNTSVGRITSEQRDLLDTLFKGVNQQIQTDQPSPDLALLYDLKQGEANHETIRKNFFENNSAYNVKNDDDSINQAELDRLNQVIETYKNCLPEKDKEQITKLQNSIQEKAKEPKRSPATPPGGNPDVPGVRSSRTFYAHSDLQKWDDVKECIQDGLNNKDLSEVKINYKDSSGSNATQTINKTDNFEEQTKDITDDKLDSVNVKTQNGGQFEYHPIGGKDNPSPSKNQPVLKVHYKKDNEKATIEAINNAIQWSSKTIDLNLDDKTQLSEEYNLAHFKNEDDATEEDKTTRLTWQDYAYLKACQEGLTPRNIGDKKLSEGVEELGKEIAPENSTELNMGAS